MEQRARRWLRRSVAWAGLTLTLTLAAGCHKATFIDPTTVAGEEHDEWTDFFLFGLVGTEEADVRRFCGGPVALVRTGGNFGTGIVSVLTLFIYTPRKIYVTCAAGGAPPGTGAPAASVTEASDGEPARLIVRVRGGDVEGRPEPVPGSPGVYRVRIARAGIVAEEAVR